MKQTIPLMQKFLILSFLILAFTQEGNAQTSISETIGNPDSQNIMMIQQTTDIIPTSEPLIPNTNMEPLPGNPGVEVSPPPSQIPEDNIPTMPDFQIDETITTN